MHWQDAALPQGSLILVTGASGFLASHIITEALRMGFRVRGTVRSDEKSRETTDLFNSNSDSQGFYSAVVVPDLADEEALLSNDKLLQDVAGIIHCASVMSFSPNPELVIGPSVASTVNILQAAKRQPSVKRFVYTSSATAITFPSTDDTAASNPITKEDWNDLAADLAQNLPLDDPAKSFAVYSASKLESERAAWKFVADEKPDFIFNSVNPATSFGHVLGSPGETGMWIPNLAMQNEAAVDIAPQYVVDVLDSARIHLAALLDSDLSNERVLAFGPSVNQNDILDSIEKARPGRALPARVDGLGRDRRGVDNASGERLLKKWWDQSGFRSLDETVRENLRGIKGLE